MVVIDSSKARIFINIANSRIATPDKRVCNINAAIVRMYLPRRVIPEDGVYYYGGRCGAEDPTENVISPIARDSVIDYDGRGAIDAADPGAIYGIILRNNVVDYSWGGSMTVNPSTRITCDHVAGYSGRGTPAVYTSTTVII